VIHDSVNNQENIPLAAAEKPTVQEVPDLASDGGKTNAVPTKKLCAAPGNRAPAKKSKVAKTASKTKVVPLQKGQKKMSAFFRM